MFAALTLLSGGFAAHARLHAAAPAAVAAGAATRPFSSEEPPAVGPARFAPAPAPAPAPQVPAPTGGTALTLKARSPGLWVVDAAGGVDADASKLEGVVASASDGDVVQIKPGFYRETLVISKSITLRGMGADRTAVTIDATGPLTAAIAGGRVRLENLTITNNGGLAGTAVAVTKAALTLVNAAVQAPGAQGLRVSDGSIEASQCELSARIALIAEGGSHLKATACAISGTEAAALVKAQAGPVDALFSKVRFRESERAINIEGSARATIDGCDFRLSGPGGAVFAFDGAQAVVRDSKIELGGVSQVGLYAQKAKITASKVWIHGSAGAGVIANKSNVTLDDTTLEYNKDCGVKADDSVVTLRRATLRHNRCGVGFQSPGQLDANESKFSDNALGPLAAKPGVESRIKLSGTGNEGAEMTPAGLAGGPQPAAGDGKKRSTNDPVQFKNDVFGQYKRRRP